MVLGPLLVTICVTFICWYLLKQRSRLPEPPPGTRHPLCLPSLPIYGSNPFLKSDTQELALQFMEKAKSLGPIFALYFGSQYTVVLNGADTIRDALVKKSLAFAGRASFFHERNNLNAHSKGIAFGNYDDAYRRKHQLYLTILRKLGFGQRLMERRFNESIGEFLRHAKSFEGRPFHPDALLGLTTLNVVASILTGESFSFGHPTLVNMKALIQDWTINMISQVDFFPLLRFVPPFRGRLKYATARHKLLLNTIEKTLSNIFSTKELTADQNDECFARYVVESSKSADMGKLTQMPPSDHDSRKLSPSEDFDIEELLFSLRDLLSGGSDTTSITMCWFLILMANHREVQTRMQKEIDAVVGRDRQMSLDDERSMPYSQAVILETMRRYTLVPLSLFHATMRDTTVGELFVPANTMVIVNLYSAHMDPAVWEDPTVFRPERFLDDNGAVYGKDRVLSFSLGKRTCPGEALARQEIFMFTTGILQTFDICPPEGKNEVKFEEHGALNITPSPFEVRFIPRGLTNN